MPKIKIKTKIGELLLEKGIITLQQLEDALELQRTKYKGEMLGEVLLHQGFISEEDIYSTLATQLGHPYIKISNCLIIPEVLQLITRKQAEEYNILPIDRIGNVFTIAMVNPLEDAVLTEIEKNTGYKVKAFVATLSELKNAIIKNYSKKK